MHFLFIIGNFFDRPLLCRCTLYILFFFIIFILKVIIYLFLEKKSSIKKLKREINSFRIGVNMYERFLQLSMNIESNEKNAVIYITINNLNNHSDHKIVFEENDNNFKRKYCITTFILFSIF